MLPYPGHMVKRPLAGFIGGGPFCVSSGPYPPAGRGRSGPAGAEGNMAKVAFVVFFLLGLVLLYCTVLAERAMIAAGVCP